MKKLFILNAIKRMDTIEKIKKIETKVIHPAVSLLCTVVLSLALLHAVILPAHAAERRATIAQGSDLQRELQNTLSISQLKAATIVRDIRSRLKNKSIASLKINRRNLGLLVNICQEYKTDHKESAEILAAGIAYAYEMQKVGAPRKDISRVMYMSIHREVGSLKNDKNQRVSASFMQQIGARLKRDIQRKVFRKTFMENPARMQEIGKEFFYAERPEHGYELPDQVPEYGR